MAALGDGCRVGAGGAIKAAERCVCVCVCVWGSDIQADGYSHPSHILPKSDGARRPSRILAEGPSKKKRAPARNMSVLSSLLTRMLPEMMPHPQDLGWN